MLRLLEMVVGLALIYLGLFRFDRMERLKGLLFGLVALAGLILAVHGILLYLVPDFFKPSL
jgi:hypothetical protein